MVKPHDDAMHALMVMSRNNLSRLLVVENGNLEGIITLKDLLRFISVKLDLEGASRESQRLAQIATQTG